MARCVAVVVAAVMAADNTTFTGQKQGDNYRRGIPHAHAPAWALLSAARSSFFICNSAVMTRPAAAGLLLSISSAMLPGTICQDSPYLSLSQPHCWAFSSPPAPSFAQ